ncbi:MAG: BamA/TamA family outer membrane protein [Candidatus Omnitrophica bacterium]|nr:BamA/TamA family outer membrane protein [Candidatus Omnitrophota bacterium]
MNDTSIISHRRAAIIRIPFMRFTRINFLILLSVFIGSVFMNGLSNAEQAEDIPYDRYSDTASDEPASGADPSPLRTLSRIPAIPLEILRTIIKKPLIFLEKYHFRQKGEHIVEFLHRNGIYPAFKGTGGGGAGPGAGVTLNAAELLKLPEPLADLGLYGWTSASINRYQYHGGGFNAVDLLWPGMYVSGDISYRDYTEEDFFGLGPDTSLGNGVTYRQLETDYSIRAGNQFTRTIRAEVEFSYRDIRIINGRDDGKSQLKHIYASRPLNGLDGADFLSETLKLVHDTRDNRKDPHSGGYETLSFSYNNAAGAPFEYFRYKADIARFIPLFDDKGVLALRAAGEYHDSVGDAAAPFFTVSRLGGYETLPGYQYNRFYDDGAVFFNAEYRYNIWQWKEWDMDAVLGFASGQVFHRVNKIQMRDFRNSYSMGLRSIYKKNVMACGQISLSDEGPELYLKFKAPF